MIAYLNNRIYYPSLAKSIKLVEKSLKLVILIGIGITLLALSDDDLCMLATGICISAYLGYYLYNKGLDRVIENKDKFYVNKNKYIVMSGNYLPYFLLYLAYGLSFITLLYLGLWTKELIQGTLDVYNKTKIFEVIVISLLVILFVYAQAFIITFMTKGITIKDYEGVAGALLYYLNKAEKVNIILERNYDKIQESLTETKDYHLIARKLLGIKEDEGIIIIKDKNSDYKPGKELEIISKKLEQRDDNFKQRGPRDI